MAQIYYFNKTKEKQRVLLEKLLADMPMFCRDYIDEHPGLSVKTLLDYTRVMKTFLCYLNAYEHYFSAIPKSSYTLQMMNEITPSIALDFVRFVSSGKTVLLSHPDGTCKPKSYATILHYITALKAYFEYWAQQRDICYNPFDSHTIQFEATTKKELTPLNEDDENRLIESVSTGKGLSCRQKKAWDGLSLRDQVILILLLDTGLRVSELTDLNIDDMNYDLCYLLVRRHGRTERVYFSDSTKKLLIAYMEHRMAERYVVDHEALLLTSVGKYRGCRLGVRSIEIIVKKYARAAGISNHTDFSAKTCRDTFSHNMLRCHGSIGLLQSQLGLSSDKEVADSILSAQRNNLR